MCYRPRPDLERIPAKRPTNEEIDRRFQKLKAELAQLREQRSKASQS
jgi:ribosomal protein L29